MDFALNDVQQELTQQARAWLGERYPLDRDWDQQDDRWAELGELGWLDVAEAGLGFVEEALLLEELGYALYPGAYLAHVTGRSDVFGKGGEIATVDPTRPLKRLPNGSAETPRLRERIAAEWIELQALRYTNYRALSTYQRTGIPGPEGSGVKLRWSEANQRMTKLARELLGPEGIVVGDGWWHHQQLRSRGNTIEAGTSEVLRNIVSERVLGLPRSR
jgi:alkylation response protein AidB-like acyl-CoA dehydrogenase